MKTNKWYIFDLDGTLLSDKNKIPQKTIDFLLNIKEDGHKLGILTGRPFEVIKECIEKKLLKHFDFISGYNGSKTLHENTLVSNEFKFSDIRLPKGNFDLTVPIGNHLYISGDTRLYHVSKRYDFVVKELNELGNNSINMIRLIFDNNSETKEYFSKLMDSNLKDEFNITMSTRVFILITKKGSSKASTIELILKNNEVIYFGDSENDIDVFLMDEVFTVAPLNANSRIKELANIVLTTTNNESLFIEI